MTLDEGFYERLVRLAPDAMVVARNGQIVLANDRAVQLFGHHHEDLIDRRIEILIPSIPSLESVAETRNDLNLIGLRKDGREFPIATTIRRMEFAGDSFLVLAIRDSSQHNPHEHRAEQMMAIGQVAAGVAHELRNPLTSIKGLVQVNLREARARGLPDEDLTVIEHEIRRMERTLQTFLDFARPPTLERRRVDPAAVVERVFAVVGGRAKKQGVALQLTKPESPVWLQADPDQLQQLLLNLVLNSLDAMPHGGAIDVDLRRPRDGFVEIQVRDTGPGIPSDILPKVFESFVSSKETGVGLGVPVSRRIAEDHGGNLSAYNSPEGGACFVLRLPPLEPASREPPNADLAGG